MTKDIGIDQGIDTPEQPIKTQPLNPPTMPVAEGQNDSVMAVAVSETDLNCIDLPYIDTVPLTMGATRPNQGYLPFGDLRPAQSANPTGHCDLLEEPLPSDQLQLSTSLVCRGVNFINPMALPPLRSSDVNSAGTALISANAEQLYFGNNGPSIATPGSTKRAAVEKSLMCMRAEIVNAFNRDIPFSSMPVADRALALKAYETELLKCQNFVQSVDRLRGYGEWQSKNGVALDASWNALYNPDAYTAFTALVQAVQDLPTFDWMSHKRLEKLGKVYASRARVAAPATCLMQDIVIAEDRYKESVVLYGTGGYSSQSCTLHQILPNYSMWDIWTEISADTTGQHFLHLVQLYAGRVSSIRTQYEMVITALAQMMAKGGVECGKLGDYLPVRVSDLGVCEFGSAEPAAAWDQHERWEYQPVWIQEEDASSNTKEGYWKVFDLPDTASFWLPAACLGRRPVGLNHAEKAWTVHEIVNIGLFKTQAAAEVSSDGPYIDRLVGTTCVWSSSGYTANTSPWTVGGGPTDASILLLDAVYGDYFTSGVVYHTTGGLSGINCITSRLHGMSWWPAGSGMHNTLAMPSANMTSGGIGVGLDGGCGNATAYVNGLAPQDSHATTKAGNWFMTQIAKACGLAVFIVFRGKTTSTRQISGLVMNGYADAGYYTMAISPVDNALGVKFNEMIPFMRYQRSRH